MKGISSLNNMEGMRGALHVASTRYLRCNEWRYDTDFGDATRDTPLLCVSLSALTKDLAN